MATVAGLAPFGVSAQDDGDLPDRATRRVRIAAARRWEEEVQGQGNTAVLTEIASPEYVSSDPNNTSGLDALIERFDAIVRQNELQYDSLDVNADAFAVSTDSVAVRSTWTVEREGRKAVVVGMSWYVFGDDNLIRAAWGTIEEGSLTTQLYG